MGPYLQDGEATYCAAHLCVWQSCADWSQGANRNLRGVREYLPNSEEFQEAVKLFFAHESKPLIIVVLGINLFPAFWPSLGTVYYTVYNYRQNEIQLVLEICLLLLYHPI